MADEANPLPQPGELPAPVGAETTKTVEVAPGTIAAVPSLPGNLVDPTVSRVEAPSDEVTQGVFLRFLGDKPQRLGPMIWGPKAVNLVTLAQSRDLMKLGNFEIVRQPKPAGN